jgi:hypothetical protein
MLGDKIGEATGRVTCTRVLPNPGGGPRMETSFEASGRVLGVASPAWSRLNGIAAVFEFEVDPQGHTRAHLWEWK